MHYCILVVLIYLISNDNLYLIQFFDRKPVSNSTPGVFSTQTCRSPTPQFPKSVKFNYNKIPNAKPSHETSFHRNVDNRQTSSLPIFNQNSINKFPQTIILNTENERWKPQSQQQPTTTFSKTEKAQKKLPVFNPDYKYFDIQNKDSTFVPKPILKNHQQIPKRNLENQTWFMNYNC